MADLMWVANTRHGPGAHWFARPSSDEGDHDHLVVPADAVRYLADHHVEVPESEPTARQLAALGVISDMVRGLPDSSGGWTDAAEGLRSQARYRIATDGQLGAAVPGWDGFIDDLMLPLTELVRSRSRLAMCGNQDCRLVFVDESKSHTRRWCDDGGCGNRVRLRRHRRRMPD